MDRKMIVVRRACWVCAWGMFGHVTFAMALGVKVAVGIAAIKSSTKAVIDKDSSRGKRRYGKFGDVPAESLLPFREGRDGVDVVS